MPSPKKNQVDHQLTLDLFYQRARRILAHSLWVEQRDLMMGHVEGAMKINVTFDPSTGESMQEVSANYPNEELFESLTARVRPVIFAREWVHYSRVKHAISAALKEAPPKGVEIHHSALWSQWDFVCTKPIPGADPHDDLQAFAVTTEHGTYADRRLADRWINSDLVHADELEPDIAETNLELRWHAAVPVVSRIVNLVEQTYRLIEFLLDCGTISISPKYSSEEVSIAATEWRSAADVRTAAVGTNPPVGLEPLGNEFVPLVQRVEEAGRKGTDSHEN